MKNIKIKIVTPERTVYEDEVSQATLPTIDGEVTVLPDHIPYITALKAGEIMLKKGEEIIHLATSGGFIEFNNNTLTMLTDTVERAEEIDIKRAEEAKQRAEELQKQRITIDDMEYAKTAALVEKELARIKVARKHRTKHEIKID